ncbi:TIGR03089 family protein, partial [Streptomyces sp. SID6013]|nr:TIGR03089 family protein [Streptomyces sp. SID6013]
GSVVLCRHLELAGAGVVDQRIEAERVSVTAR